MYPWSKETYVFMKWLQRIFLPAAVGFGSGFCMYFGSDHLAAAIGSIGALAIVFLGAITGGAEYEYSIKKREGEG